MATGGPSSASDGVESGFGLTLRRFRLRAGFSQAALARASGLSVDAIAALERGRRKAPRAVTIRLLADALKIGDADRKLLQGADPALDLVDDTMGLPPQPTDEVVGRDDEIDVVVDLLGHPDTRMLTLIGTGGVGKTTLAAVAVKQHLQGRDKDVCWVPLSAIPEGVGLAQAVARQALVVEPTGPDALGAMIYRFNQGPVLLVLDSCEHLLDDVAELCKTLLARCPQLQILATSRESLWMPGERVYAVPPLPLPPPGCPVEELHLSAAVALFCARASSLSKRIADAELPAVARICQQLAGIPLAIELAAARSTIFSAEQLAVALDDSLGVLTSGRRIADPRHRTLANAIGWSHDLLSPEERDLFARLSVFRGGWTLAGARAVGPTKHPTQTLDVMARLVDKSLIVVKPGPTEARYEILEPIRQYAAARLASSEAEDEVRLRHAEYYAGLIIELDRVIRTSDDYSGALDRIENEVPNIEAAISWAGKADRVQLVSRIANGIWRFSALRGRYSDGQRWMDAALASSTGDDHVRAESALGAGTLALLSCSYVEATEHLHESLRIFTALDHSEGQANALQRLGSVARERGQYGAAEELHRTGLELWRGLGDAVNEATTLNYLAFVAWLRGDLPAAGDLASQAYRYFRTKEDSEGTVWALLNLGVTARYRGRWDEGQKLLLDALSVSDEIGIPEGAAWALDHLGALERLRGNLDHALELLNESLAAHIRLGDKWRAASTLDELGIARSHRGDWARSAYLHGLAASMREAVGVPSPACEATAIDASIAQVRAELTSEEFETTWEAGQNSLWRTESTVPPPSSFPRLPTIRHDRRSGTPPP